MIGEGSPAPAPAPTFVGIAVFRVAGASEGALREGSARGRAKNLARDLVNEPSNVLDPPELARRARAMAAEVGLECQVLEPVDYMGFIGRDPGFDNVYLATGDSGQGMTHGTIAGILLTDLVMGRENPWEKIYDPRRVSLSPEALKEFAKENADVAVASHCRARAKLGPGEPSAFRMPCDSRLNIVWPLFGSKVPNT